MNDDDAFYVSLDRIAAVLGMTDVEKAEIADEILCIVSQDWEVS